MIDESHVSACRELGLFLRKNHSEVLSEIARDAYWWLRFDVNSPSLAEELIKAFEQGDAIMTLFYASPRSVQNNCHIICEVCAKYEITAPDYFSKA